jgi:hypothetical protein
MLTTEKETLRMAKNPVLVEAYRAAKLRDVGAMSSLVHGILERGKHAERRSVLRQVERLVEIVASPLPAQVPTKKKPKRGEPGRSVIPSRLIRRYDLPNQELQYHFTKGYRLKTLSEEDATLSANFFLPPLPPTPPRRAARVPQSIYLNGPGKRARRLADAARLSMLEAA